MRREPAGSVSLHARCEFDGLVQSVIAPEEFIADRKTRRAKNSPAYGLVGLRAKALFDAGVPRLQKHLACPRPGLRGGSSQFHNGQRINVHCRRICTHQT